MTMKELSEIRITNLKIKMMKSGKKQTSLEKRLMKSKNLK